MTLAIQLDAGVSGRGANRPDMVKLLVLAEAVRCPEANLRDGLQELLLLQLPHVRALAELDEQRAALEERNLRLLLTAE
eukprot:11182179-Lingulodinium_polyedra.AAC.1